MDSTSEFVAAARARGLVLDSVQADGVLHRVPVEGRPRAKRDGWYVLHGSAGGRLYGAFGRWDDCRGHESWVEDETRRPLTEAEQRAMWDARKAALDAEREAQREAAARAAKTWGACTSKGTSDYLTRKRVAAHGVRFSGGDIVVPLRDVTGQLWSVQTISPDGRKLFFEGGRTRDCYHQIGRRPAGGEPFLLAEGYATGAALYESTGYTTVCAMSCGNLSPVAEVLVLLYRDARLIVCADDDVATQARTGTNPGIEAARAVATKLGVPWARPEGLHAEGGDFNDLMLHAGPEAVCAIVARAVEGARTVAVGSSPSGPVIGTVVRSTSPSPNSAAHDTSVTGDTVVAGLPSAPPDPVNGARGAGVAAPEAWPEPALPGSIRTPTISAELLPSWVRDMAAAVATWSQTPPAMAVMVALSVLASVLQRRFEIAPRDDEYREPLSLWTLTALPSGSRKTAVINAMTEPLVAWEKLERDRMRQEIARVYAARQVAEKRIEKLKNDAARAESREKRMLAQEEIQREREQMPAEVFAPRIFTGDVTGERLQQLLVEQDERMTVLTDEGGIFSIMAGLYSGGASSLDVFLQGHSGTPMRVDRAGRLAHVDRPALSFGLALQPDVLTDVAKARRFRASGLLARFLYAMPVSNVGQRDVRARYAIPVEVRAAWRHHIMALLDGMQRPIGEPGRLHFDPDALECWLQFAEEIEAHQGAGGRWEHISDWTAKLPGAATRIAALMELAENGIETLAVGAESARRATELCRLLIRHAEAAFSLMGAADAEGDALALLRWIEAHRLPEFTRREAHKAMEGRFRTVERLIAAVRLLQDWCVLGPERARGNPRARATHFYQVNPRLFSSDPPSTATPPQKGVPV